MKQYYINTLAQPTGDHEVHVEGCARMPYTKLELGKHYTCHSALAEARKYYPTADGCVVCCNPCHKD